ncbi:MAG: hypothetical protein IJ851_03745 [Eubacterium sp.]|nr:hypothetical protein [Eubacterium sp.]
MKKNKSEIEKMANAIGEKYGFFLNVTEIGKVLGVSRETARKIASHLPIAAVEGMRKYYVNDILEYVYK